MIKKQSAHGGKNLGLEFQRFETNNRNKNSNLDKTKFYKSNNKIKEFN